MHLGMKLASALVVTVLGGLLGTGLARAEVQVIVPYGPGGNIDQIARKIAELVKPYQSEPWSVVNRPGAAGNIGLAQMVRAKPDGKTLSVTGSSFLLHGFISDVPWRGPEDIDVIAILMNTPQIHYVRGDSPFKSMAELIEYSKKNPGKLRYGATGSTGVATIRYNMLRTKDPAIDWTRVPFADDAAALTAVLGGHIDHSAGGIAGLSGQAKAGAIRFIAVPEEARLPTLPDVPTFLELGYPVVLQSYILIAAPKGLPADVRQNLAEALRKAMANPEYDKFAKDSDATPVAAFDAEKDRLIQMQYKAYHDAVPLLGVEFRK